jgi:hypothetical protein
MTSRSVVVLFVAAVLLVLALPAQAFRSTKQESFTDPDYTDFKPSIVMISVLSNNVEIREAIEQRLTRDLSKRGIKVFDESDLFPPTRNWDADQRAEILSKHNVDAIIVVGIGSSSHDVSQIAANTFTSGSVYGYGNSATVTGTSTTVPIVSAKSKSSFSAALIDAKNGRTAWITDIFTKAGGLLFAGGKKDAKAAANALVKGLAKDGHLPSD